MCTLEKRGPIFILTLTGATDHRLSPALIASIRSLLADVRSTAAPGSALLTTADGRFFSNGFDLAAAKSAPTPALARAALSSMVSLFRPLVADLLSLPLPTVAAVPGHAAAAGLLLALSHDYIVKSSKGVLYMSEVDLGLPFPEYFMAVMREKIADPRVLRDVAMRGVKMTGKEAGERGVVDRVCGTPEETVAEGVRLAEELAGRKWDGEVYQGIRRAAFPVICKAVGLPEEEAVAKEKVFASKL